jgi:2-phosphosulfolactate phosphatase
MPKPKLSVVFRKEDIRTAVPPLAGRHAVVIDVLRASSSIVTALHNGALELRMAATPEEAREIAATLPPGSYLLGGERGGVRIEGFDLGNSPSEYTRERVAGKIIVFTTTNGTEAGRACAEMGAAIWIGSLINAPAIARVISACGVDIVLVCAGTEGTAGRDDVYAAGAIAECIHRGGTHELDDSAAIAMGFYREEDDSGKRPPPGDVLRASRGGRNLIELGLGNDIADCDGSKGCFDIAPHFENGRIIDGKL